jgi:hypothetical protein
VYAVAVQWWPWIGVMPAGQHLELERDGVGRQPAGPERVRYQGTRQPRHFERGDSLQCIRAGFIQLGSQPKP